MSLRASSGRKEVLFHVEHVLERHRLVLCTYGCEATGRKKWYLTQDENGCYLPNICIFNLSQWFSFITLFSLNVCLLVIFLSGVGAPKLVACPTAPVFLCPPLGS